MGTETMVLPDHKVAITEPAEHLQDCSANSEVIAMGGTT